MLSADVGTEAHEVSQASELSQAVKCTRFRPMSRRLQLCGMTEIPDTAQRKHKVEELEKKVEEL